MVVNLREKLRSHLTSIQRDDFYRSDTKISGWPPVISVDDAIAAGWQTTAIYA